MILLDDIEEKIYYGGDQEISYNLAEEHLQNSMKGGVYSIFKGLPRKLYNYDHIISDINWIVGDCDAIALALEKSAKSQGN
jgi:hypothetical protein